MTTKTTRSTFITHVRQVATELLDVIDDMMSLRKQWDAGMSTWIVDASGNDPNEEGYQSGDFAGSNAGLMKADIASVVGTTLDALNVLMDSGHRTNLEKIRN